MIKNPAPKLICAAIGILVASLLAACAPIAKSGEAPHVPTPSQNCTTPSPTTRDGRQHSTVTTSISSLPVEFGTNVALDPCSSTSEGAFDQQTLQNMSDWISQNQKMGWIKSADHPTILRVYQGHNLLPGEDFVDGTGAQELLTVAVLGAADPVDSNGNKAVVVAIGAFESDAQGNPKGNIPVVILLKSDDNETVWYKFGTENPPIEGDPLNTRVFLPSSFTPDPVALATRINTYTSPKEMGLLATAVLKAGAVHSILSGKAPGLVTDVADSQLLPSAISSLTAYFTILQALPVSP